MLTEPALTGLQAQPLSLTVSVRLDVRSPVPRISTGARPEAVVAIVAAVALEFVMARLPPASAMLTEFVMQWPFRSSVSALSSLVVAYRLLLPPKAGVAPAFTNRRSVRLTLASSTTVSPSPAAARAAASDSYFCPAVSPVNTCAT